MRRRSDPQHMGRFLTRMDSKRCGKARRDELETGVEVGRAVGAQHSHMEKHAVPYSIPTCCKKGLAPLALYIIACMLQNAPRRAAPAAPVTSTRRGFFLKMLEALVMPKAARPAPRAAAAASLITGMAILCVSASLSFDSHKRGGKSKCDSGEHLYLFRAI